MFRGETRPWRKRGAVRAAVEEGPFVGEDADSTQRGGYWRPGKKIEENLTVRRDSRRALEHAPVSPRVHRHLVYVKTTTHTT